MDAQRWATRAERGADNFCMMRLMRSEFTGMVQTHASRWKSEWERRLRAEPVLNAMAEPSILFFLMDRTLEDFQAVLDKRSAGGRARVAHPCGSAPPLRDACRCGLNPLLAYFATGRDALEAVLKEDAALPEERREVLSARWSLLARREIELLCGACRRPEAATVVSATVAMR